MDKKFGQVTPDQIQDLMFMLRREILESGMLQVDLEKILGHRKDREQLAKALMDTLRTVVSDAGVHGNH